MSFYNGYECPVCHKTFGDDDDVVCCPICGTPHHRECYDNLGHCANQSLHSEGYNFRKDSKSTEKQNGADLTDKQNADVAKNSKAQDNTKTVCSVCGAEIKAGTPFCNKCGARQHTTSQYVPPVALYQQTDSASYSNVIDNQAAEDVAAVVRSNVDYFLPKFKKNKKTSWNWGAFFFGPYYLFFRKMNKQGAMVMAFQLAVSLFVQGFFSKQIATASDYIYSNYSQLMSGTFSPDMSILQPVIPAMAIIFGAYVLINIVVAVFANNMYRKKVMLIVQNVDDKLDEGSMFEQTALFEQQMNISQSDMRTIYLSKIGGTSIFSPILAYLVLDMVTMLISKII